MARAWCFSLNLFIRARKLRRRRPAGHSTVLRSLECSRYCARMGERGAHFTLRPATRRRATSQHDVFSSGQLYVPAPPHRSRLPSLRLEGQNPRSLGREAGEASSTRRSEAAIRRDLHHREGLWPEGQSGRRESPWICSSGEPKKAYGPGSKLAAERSSATLPFLGILARCRRRDGTVYDSGGFDAP